MFIWREPYNYQYAIADDCIIIRTQYKNHSPAMRFPIGAGDKQAAFEKMLEYCAANGERMRLYSITQDMVQELNQIAPDMFDVAEVRDYYDYVYGVADLIQLKGKKYHAKRNHLNSFLQNYQSEYSRITPDNVGEIIKTYDTWTIQRENGANYFLQKERESIEIILRNIELLNLTCGKITANGKLCGFSIGEPLNDETAVIHIEKADTLVRGAYQAINQMFLKNEWSNYTYVNREDDSGVEGLRKAKMSYHPCLLIKKYEAKQK